MKSIEVDSLVKKFGDFTAVNGISFAVEDGEIFGLLGPNGAGKSTLIRMLVTLLPPTSGSAIVNGYDIVKQANGVRRSIGVIPQAMTTDLELSVEENLIIFAKLYGVPRQKREQLMAELLDWPAEHVRVLEQEEHRPEGDRSAEPERTADREREGVPERDRDQRARPDDRATDDRLPSSREPGAMLKDQAVHHVALGAA